jgi:PAS domain S-box-containing protein
VKDRSLHILLVEDNEDDARLIARELQVSGFKPLITRVDTPGAMNAALSERSWDAVLADWHLPRFSALFALEMLKSKGLDLPFIIVSSKIGETAAVSAMKAGAHDYVMKNNLARLIPVIVRELRDAEERRARRRAEQALALSEERLQLVVRATNDAVRDWDLTTNSLWWNEGLQTLFGYQAQDIESGVESWYSRLHPEEKERVLASCYAAINSSTTAWSLEYRFRRADGAYAHVLDRSYILRNVRGEALRLIGALTDLTASKQMVKSLRQSEHRLRTVLDSSPDAIIGIDEAGRITDWNPRAEIMFGWSKQEATGRLLAETILPEQQRDPYDHSFRSALETGGGPSLHQRQELTVLRRDGSKLFAELSVVPLKLKESPSPTFYAFLTDITERKRTELALRSTEEQLRQSQKMEAIGQLAGGIAHDFNNLITVITGYCDLLLDSFPQGTEGRGELGEIKSAADRATWLIGQLLAFSRRQVLVRQVVDLNVLVRNLEKLLRRLIAEDIKLNMTLDQNLARVKVDPGQMEQVVMNLALNARDAMAKGGVLTIETANTEVDETYPQKIVVMPPGRYVMLAVSDTGSGMTAETQARIFEPFFTTKEPGKGTGLGLSTVYGIVKQSEGFIWVYSELAQGTTFKIYLPAVHDEPEAVLPQEARSDREAVGTETILVVEDDDALRQLTKQVLESRGFTVLMAANGDEAFSIAQNYDGPIHLLLIDVVIPGASGRVTAERLLRHREGLKVLFMSGYAGSAMARYGLLDAGTPLLQKPFSPKMLLQKVREILDDSPNEKL